MSAQVIPFPQTAGFKPRPPSAYRHWLVYEQRTLIASFRTRRELEEWCRDLRNICGRRQLTVFDPRDRIIEQSALQLPWRIDHEGCWHA